MKMNDGKKTDFDKVDYRNPIKSQTDIKINEFGAVSEFGTTETFVETESRFKKSVYFKLWGDAVIDISVDKVSPVYCTCEWKYNTEGFDFTNLIELERKKMANKFDCDIKFIEEITEEEYIKMED